MPRSIVHGLSALGGSDFLMTSTARWLLRAAALTAFWAAVLAIYHLLSTGVPLSDGTLGSLHTPLRYLSTGASTLAETWGWASSLLRLFWPVFADFWNILVQLQPVFFGSGTGYCVAMGVQSRIADLQSV